VGGRTTDYLFLLALPAVRGKLSRMPATQTCPSCGAQSSGKFCSECGAPLAEITCAHCGATLPARAKFCGECGAAVPGAARRLNVSARATPRGDRFAWYVAGVAVLGLLVVIVITVGRRSAAPAPAAPAAPAAAIDLSTMSPREQADRLFNKVMTLQEAGKADSVAFFAPMALGAYANLGPDLDPDSRLHLGLIELAVGQTAAAAAQGDTIVRGARTHLFGWLLKAQAALQAGDSAAGRRALRTYLQNYQAERAKNLAEYGEHTTMLQEVRDEAERLVPKAAGR
jgi:hypothetical protein